MNKFKINDRAKFLNQYIKESQNIKFEYGKIDCALWVASFIGQLANIDLIEPYKGKYKNIRGYLKLLTKYGYVDLIQLVDDKLKRIPVKLASRCDIVMIKNALGICNGRLSHFLMKEGLTEYLTLKCDYAWRII